MKFTLISEEFAGKKTTVEFHAHHLEEVLENMKMFLQGSGFVLSINDRIEVNDYSENLPSWEHIGMPSDTDVPLHESPIYFTGDSNEFKVDWPEEESEQNRGRY